LTWDFLKLIKDQKYKVVSSLPYNVAKKILRIFLTSINSPEIISVIIQKEVADNYLANAPKSTFLSNFLNIYADVTFIEDIPSFAFYPEPKVQSTKVSISKHKVLSPEPKKLISFIKMGYANPRKMLLNNLSNSLNKTKQEMSEIFKVIKIDAKVRPENLGLDNWQALFNKIYPC
jgi:16S rRNA (adenine1518-N6/adenine1519-N6)-dimethyltransferase